MCDQFITQPASELSTLVAVSENKKRAERDRGAAVSNILVCFNVGGSRIAVVIELLRVH